MVHDSGDSIQDVGQIHGADCAQNDQALISILFLKHMAIICHFMV